MRKFQIVVILACTIVMLSGVAHSSPLQNQNSPTQPSESSITQTSASASPTTSICNVDFENSTKIDNVQLDLSPCPIGNSFSLDPGGARMWIETGLSHSGSKSVGMEVSDQAKSRRNEFNFFDMQNVVGDKLSVSEWLYLPADFGAQPSGVGWNWFELVVFFSEEPANAPYMTLTLYQFDTGKQAFDLAINEWDVNNVKHVHAYYKNYPLPLGRWFNVQFYLFRHPTNGILMVWLDGHVLCDESGLTTKVAESYFTSVAKIYTVEGDKSPRRIWVDDLQIYKGEVPPVTTIGGVSGFPMESLLGGSALGLLFVIVRSRQRTSKRIPPSRQRRPV